MKARLTVLLLSLLLSLNIQAKNEETCLEVSDDLGHTSHFCFNLEQLYKEIHSGPSFSKKVDDITKKFTPYVRGRIQKKLTDKGDVSGTPKYHPRELENFITEAINEVIIREKKNLLTFMTSQFYETIIDRMHEQRMQQIPYCPAEGCPHLKQLKEAELDFAYETASIVAATFYNNAIGLVTKKLYDTFTSEVFDQ